MTTVRLAPFLLLAIAVLACGSPPPASAPVAPAGADVEDVSFEISALM
ncbi:MAG TPA: hypothetical protein VJP45_10585 [Candidatus Limnocylindria bacterium]|nr:hypothetical protein [Candidatus Limnocylindria bacterium]